MKRFAVALVICVLSLVSVTYAQTITLTPLADRVVIGRSAGFSIDMDTAGKQVGVIDLIFNCPMDDFFYDGISINFQAFDQCLSSGAHEVTLGRTGTRGVCGIVHVGTMWGTPLKVGVLTMGLDNFSAWFGPAGERVEGFTVISGQVKVMPTPEPSGFLVLPAGLIGFLRIKRRWK